MVAATTGGNGGRMLARFGTVGGLLVGIRMFVADRPDALLAFRMMGFGGPLIAVVSVLAAIALLFIARGEREAPHRLPLGTLAASSPLVVAFLPFALGLARTMEAIRGADLPFREVLLAAGTAESSMCLLFGGAITSGLLVALIATTAFESLAGGGLRTVRTALAWQGLLAVLATGICFVLGPWADATSGVANPDVGASSLVAGIDVVRTDAWFFAAALVLGAGLAIAFTAIDGAPTVANLGTAGVVTAVIALYALGGFVATSRVNAARPEFYTRHLDAFAPLALAGSRPQDGGVVVVVAGSLVDEAGLHRFDAATLARLAPRTRGFALDARVDAGSLRALVGALGRARSSEIALLGVVHRGDELARVRALARIPILGLGLPVASEVTVDLAPSEAHSGARGLRCLARHGATPRVVDAAGSRTTPDEAESVAVVITDDTTALDLGAAVELVRGLGAFPRVVTSTDSLPAAPPPAPAPRVELDPAATHASMMRASPGVRRCYERALRQDPSVAGRADVAITIGAGGHVTHVEVTTDTLPATMTRCIEQVMNATTMQDPGAESVDVRFPFVFQRSGN